MASSAFRTAGQTSSPYEALGASDYAAFKTVLVHMKGGAVRDALEINTATLGLIRDSGQAKPCQIERIQEFLTTAPVIALLARANQQAAQVREKNQEATAVIGAPAFA